MGIRVFSKFRLFTIISVAFLLLIPHVTFEMPAKFFESSSASSPPTIDNVTVSSYYVYLFYKFYIHVNATDFEDEEQFLKIYRIEWRENSSLNNDPPLDPWHTDSTKLSINLDEGYSSGGYIRASITPSDTARFGRYDIRVSVNDSDGEYSNWWYIHDAFIVTTPPLSLIDLTLKKNEVLRGDTVFITLNGSGLYYNESELTVEIQYRKIGDVWTDLIITPDMYVTSDGGYWKVPFSPGLDWLDRQLGNYIFHGRVKNDVGAYSEGGAWRSTDHDCEVKNNVPESISLSAEGNTVERGSSILILAKGDDREEGEEDLVVEVEYSTDGGTTWEDEYLDDLDYNTGDSQWEIMFSPESNAEIVDYDFRIRFYDGQDYSNWLVKKNLIKVNNSIPVVVSCEISHSRLQRMYHAILHIVVFDGDQNFNTLIPNLQYKGPNDEDWIGQNESDYFDSANYDYRYWIVFFTPHADADIGDYSFRLQFTDKSGFTSEPYDLIDVLSVVNSEPEVNIQNPRPGSQDSPIITFEAIGSDSEDSELSWLWDFGDGEVSDEESPVHAFKRRGGYTVTVMVMDNDGSIGRDTVRLSIRDEINRDSDGDGLTDLKEFELGTDLEDPDTDSDGIPDGRDSYPLDPMRWRSPLQDFFLVIMVVALSLTLIISYLTLRKLKNKEKKEVEK